MVRRMYFLGNIKKLIVRTIGVVATTMRTEILCDLTSLLVDAEAVALNPIFQSTSLAIQSSTTIGCERIQKFQAMQQNPFIYSWYLLLLVQMEVSLENQTCILVSLISYIVIILTLMYIQQIHACSPQILLIKHLVLYVLRLYMNNGIGSSFARNAHIGKKGLFTLVLVLSTSRKEDFMPGIPYFE